MFLKLIYLIIIFRNIKGLMFLLIIYLFYWLIQAKFIIKISYTKTTVVHIVNHLYLKGWLQ